MPQDDEDPVSIGGDAGNALTVGLGLTRKQQSLIIRVAWVVIMSAQTLWAWGAFSIFGLPGFARADDVKRLQQTIEASARVTLSQEIRAQARVRCTATDPALYDSLTLYIDRLQFEYERVAGARFPEPLCKGSATP